MYGRNIFFFFIMLYKYIHIFFYHRVIYYTVYFIPSFFSLLCNFREYVTVNRYGRVSNVSHGYFFFYTNLRLNETILTFDIIRRHLPFANFGSDEMPSVMTHT